MMMKIPQDLCEFIASLNAAGVKYVVVGGYAVAFHGHPRFTGDIDILVDPTLANGELITRAIDAFGFAGLGLQPSDFTQPDTIIQLGYPPNRVDLLTDIPGVTFAEAWNDRVSGNVQGVAVPFISRALLIKNKKASNRPKDQADISALE